MDFIEANSAAEIKVAFEANEPIRATSSKEVIMITIAVKNVFVIGIDHILFLSLNVFFVNY